MNDINEETTPVTRTLIAEDKRMDHTANLFGAHFPLVIEPIVYTVTGRMAEDYTGGYWQFWRLSNGGFFMNPEADAPFNVQSANGWHGQLSPIALGVVVSLTAFSHLSFSRNEELGRLCATHYHRLRPYVFELDQVSEVLRATD